MKRRVVYTGSVILLITALLLISCEPRQSKLIFPAQLGRSGEIFPEIVAIDRDGKFEPLNKFQGQNLLISIINLDYPSARAQLRVLELLKKDLHEMKITPIALILHRRPYQILNYFFANRQYKIETFSTYLNFNLAIGGIAVHPTSFSVDTNFRIIQRMDGYLNPGPLLSLLKESMKLINKEIQHVQ